jgi:Trk K+ transport system NAD-binding subunit
VNKAIADKKLIARLNTNLISIDDDKVTLSVVSGDEKLQLKNDLVFIFAGGELPTLCGNMKIHYKPDQ